MSQRQHKDYLQDMLDAIRIEEGASPVHAASQWAIHKAAPTPAIATQNPHPLAVTSL